MVIHSVAPMNMLVENPIPQQLCVKDCGGFFLEGYSTAEGFQVSRLHSTDPAMYLDKKYTPGSFYK